MGSGRSSLRYDFNVVHRVLPTGRCPQGVAHWALGIALPYAMR